MSMTINRVYLWVLAASAMVAAYVATSLPASAQAANEVGDLGDTLVTRAGTAIVAGFAVAAVVLGAVIGFRLIKRFLG